jgi:hypothetical protein
MAGSVAYTAAAGTALVLLASAAVDWADAAAAAGRRGGAADPAALPVGAFRFGIDGTNRGAAPAFSKPRSGAAGELTLRFFADAAADAVVSEARWGVAVDSFGRGVTTVASVSVSPAVAALACVVSAVDACALGTLGGTRGDSTRPLVDAAPAGGRFEGMLTFPDCSALLTSSILIDFFCCSTVAASPSHFNCSCPWEATSEPYAAVMTER